MIELSDDPLPDTLVNTALVAPILPTLALPVTFNVPLIFAPVPVTVIIFALPDIDIVILPLPITFTLLLPLDKVFTAILAAVSVPLTVKLPILALPVLA